MTCNNRLKLLAFLPLLAFSISILSTGTGAQDSALPEEKQRKTIDMPLDLPALAEIDSLHDPDAAIRRYFLTSQGMRGQTVPIEGTEGWFCTLSQDTHVMLDFWPNLNQWVFQIGFSEEAELTSGGLATCHKLSDVAGDQ